MKPKTIITIVLIAFVAVSAVWLIASEINKAGMQKAASNTNSEIATKTNNSEGQPLTMPSQTSPTPTEQPTIDAPKQSEAEAQSQPKKKDNAYVIAYYLHTTRR
jgi:hypothetical protein